MINDLEGDPVKAGTFAFSTNYYQVGARLHDWSIAVFQRYDFYAQFSNETAQVIHAARNKIKIDDNQMFQIQLKGTHLRANGLKGGYQIRPAPSVSIDLNLSYLYADGLYEGDLTGELTSSDDGVQGDLNLDYGYSRDIFFKRDRDESLGHGYSVDIGARWEWSDNVVFTVEVSDLLNRVYWSGQPHTAGEATSDTVSYDSNGLIDARPVAEWLEDEKSIIQELPKQYKLNAHYQFLHKWRLLGQVYRYDTHSFHRVGLSYIASPSHRVLAMLDMDTRSLSLGYWGRYGGLYITADSLDLHKTHSLGLNAGLHWPI